MKKLILLGGGGHCKSVIDSIRSRTEYSIIGILDLKENINKLINGVKIIGTDEDLEKYSKEENCYGFITAGSIGNTDLRRSLVNLCEIHNVEITTIIDQTAIVSGASVIGKGVFIGKGAIVNADACIMDHCIINTGAIVEHDCNIGNFVHIAPGSVLSGSVKVGDFSHVGTNSTVIQGVTIGNNVIIGAGTVVNRNVPASRKIVGNPWREI